MAKRENRDRKPVREPPSLDDTSMDDEELSSMDGFGPPSSEIVELPGDPDTEDDSVVFEHAEEPQRYIESFYVASWLEHLRQHDRVTDEDRQLQQHIRGLLSGLGCHVVGRCLLAHDAAPGC